MCGILFAIQNQHTTAHAQYQKTWAILEELNSRRGKLSNPMKNLIRSFYIYPSRFLSDPIDPLPLLSLGPSAQETHHISIPASSNGSDNSTFDLTFYGAVLHLRGDTVTRQPHIGPSGNVLIWNGEIFDGIFVDHHQNDGQVLMALLESIADYPQQGVEGSHAQQFLKIMSKIEGPYAFVYYHASSQKVYFGRDCLGRRSLLWHKPSADNQDVTLPFVLTSVGYSVYQTDLLPLDEVPADGIYAFSLKESTINSIMRYPWIPSEATPLEGSLAMKLSFGRVNDKIPEEDQLSVPFDETLKFDKAHPEVVPPMTLDMEAAVKGMIAVLGDSVRRRVQDIPMTRLRHDARVGILFSGGLDCLTLAALADRFLPEGEAIDLLNVGFENPRVAKARAAEVASAKKQSKKQAKKPNNAPGSEATAATDQETEQQSTLQSSSSIAADAGGSGAGASATKYNVPDRVTGYESLQELKRIAPQRHWNFVEVNVPFEEAMAKRQEILERIAPLETVMDLSIAMAFWFASRGIGYLQTDQGDRIPYTSQAKVLLSGLGADEQLGGYSRHKDQFALTQWEGLIKELQLDLDRISTRNLGRDDRIISDHGKEARYPFLCTNVVQYLCQLRVDLKVDLRYPRGVGEKILLRHVARALGFQRASTHWKRAVQFGAKTAKMTESGRSEIGQQVVSRAQES
ncbi:hypothetical protein BGW38_001727 [Lunasporangiospora selenospora]|uniref:Asparagine synthetase domain-containing protein n=1 Tax=Lunasporangiospora selenospora TaxID=979761 RepID=A0A9P6KE23_9FUNG|nr:hypothetical protein BGW38_001727 [Lunasporangiospora selenospora]